MHTDDPMELKVAGALRRAGIKFVHESEDKEQGLDFWLPDDGISIEVKQFSTPRTDKQIEHRNVILIQTVEAVDWFCNMLLRGSINR